MTQQRVRALEPHVEYIPKVVVSLDAHLSHPTGPFPNFTAIANEDTTIDPHHPWLKKVRIEVDSSTDHEARHPLGSGKSTPRPTPRPQEKGEHQGSRKSPYKSYSEESGIVTEAVEGGLDANTTPIFAGKGKLRGRSPSSLQSTHQPSVDVEHTSTGAGSAEAEPASENQSLHQPEFTVPGTSAGDPQPRPPLKRTFEASHPPSRRPRHRTRDQPPASLPSWSSDQVCESCGKRPIEDRISALEGVILQLLHAIAQYRREG
ncbi:hypothetical protein JVU11DRAFT_9293 [Chiua virens]|nr:hypothetical protein JVU11DRAFT_9293 [Chiua virens]